MSISKLPAFLLFTFLFLVRNSHANFTFSYTPPTSCDDFTIKWTPDAVGNVEILLIPEHRMQKRYSISASAGNHTVTSSDFNFSPADKFVIVLTDATNFTSISDLITVGGVANPDCNTVDIESQPFNFHIEPEHPFLVACQSVDIIWNGSYVPPITIRVSYY
ncbi:hypothetical protein M422DRAFT_277407 [Sphaerobolus stellatus SS14]|uniref:Uncharacterized protein n=1 Tax=Sphaerobolus stellatus (strain SS14) TaxID=990650 RepID=A0A0C9UAR6_SPHS4|nr:hypothetical protein M422DRAFT_277407 [Sphaerobolus stellatus SS14]